MARRPVVIQGPPTDTPRKPVVIREGPPPRDRRSIVDAVIGAAGAILLIVAIALFGILPEEDVPARTWNVTYEENTVEDGEVQDLFFNEQQSMRYAFPVNASNVHSIQFTIEFADDVPSSLPDTFAFQIFAPDSEPVTEELRFASPEPESDGNPLAPTFTAGTLRQIITAELAAPPKDGPQVPASDEEDLPNAQARIQDATNTKPAGDWILDIFLVETGDCPPPTAPGGPGHAATCELATGQAGDPGNPLQIVKVSFTTYDAMVEA